MKTFEKVAIVGGIGLLGVGAFLAFKLAGGEQSPGDDGHGNFVLQTIAGEGGTITPNTTSGVPYPSGTTVTLTATPNSGFTVGAWMVDGHDVNSQASTYIVTMDRGHSVIVTFWEGGVPPPENTVPVAISAVDASKKVYGYYGCVLTLMNLNILDAKGLAYTTVNYCDANWHMGGIAEYPVSFRVIDGAGRPVPNSVVEVWTDTGPDIGKYSGYLILNKLGPNAHAFPTTNSEGIVTVNLSYFYGINDKYETLCFDAGLKYTICSIPDVLYCENFSPIDGALGIPSTYFKPNTAVGDCYTMQPGTQSAKMGPFVVNYVHAKVAGTAIPATAAIAYCGFHVKMLPTVVE